MERISKMWRSALAMVLAICMVLSFCPVAAFAAEPAKKYVSLGDSMTNGYGLTGYDDPYRVNGFLDEVLDAYPYQLQDELNFDLTAQLATSAMRAEDLNYILRYPNAQADRYTKSEFVDNRWNDYKGIDNSKSGVANVAEIFQTNVANADVITYNIGNANFGVFMLGRLTNAMNILVDEGKYDQIQANEAWVNFENALGRLDASQKKVAMEAYNQGMNMLKKYLPASAPVDKIERLADILGFTIASYLDYTEAALDRINELNPDAEIIIVGVQNNFSGVDLDLTIEGKKYSVPMSTLLAPFVEGANAYLSVLPSAKHAAGEWTGNTFYYAEAKNIGMIVDTYNDEIVKKDNVIRDRFITEVCDTVFPMIEGALDEMLADTGLELVELTRADVEAYENDTLADDNKILSAAIYLAFEKAILEAADMKTLDATAFMSVMDDLSKVFEPVAEKLETELEMEAIADTVIEEVKAEAIAKANAYKATYSVVEQELFDKLVDMATGVETSLAVVVAHYALDTGIVDIEDVKASDLSAITNTISQIDEDKIVEWAEDKYGDVLKHSTAVHVADEIEEPLADALVSAPVVKSLLNLFARMLIGNGIGCHPSAAGHDTLTAAIVKAYETKHTTEDEVKDDINYVLGELKNFLETYGPEAADQAYKMWVEMGYQDLVDQYITELTDTLGARYTNYTEVVLPALNSALDALNAQKDTLIAELATLNAQLQAKKAELEKVLSEQKITEITPPEFDIDTELGNNEQTQVPENDCAGVGNVADELAAAVADLEHAIAVIEALIADVTADIEDLVALATEIAEGVATLEQTLTDVAAAAQDLKAAVDAVVAVLTDDSAKAASKTFMKAFNAAREAAVIAADALNLIVETVNGDVAAIEASIETLKECANALVGKFDADKEDILGKILAEIPTEYQMVIGASAKIIMDTLEENKGAIMAALETEKAALLAELEAKKAELEAEYAPQIAEAQAKVDALKAQIDAEIQAKYAELQAEAQVKIDALKQEAQAKIDALTVELQGYVEQLAGEISDEVRAELQAQIDRINNDIATINEDLSCALGHIDTELQEAYNELVEEIKNAYNESLAELENILNALVNDFETAIKNLQDAYEAAIKELLDAADKAIQELVDAAQKELDKLGEIGEILSGILDGIYEAIRGDISTAQQAIFDILHGALDSVTDLVDALVDIGVNGVDALVDEVTEVINEMMHAATHADLELGADSLYIALGDGTAVPEGYVEKLAAQLEAEYGVENFTNYAEARNTVGAEVDKVAGRSGIAEADLITIGFGNATLLENAIRNGTSVEYDWAGLVGADLVPYVEEALAEVYAEIAKAGIDDAKMAAILNAYVEGLAYGAVEYAVELPALVNAIREVNADAVIVIVGQYNPIEGVVLEMGGASLDLSEYIGYFVDAVAVHGIGYAMITGDAIFVEAPEVETSNTDMSWSMGDLMDMMMYAGFNALYPSESGDTYITNQILGALNITKIEVPVLLGDVNDDGVVDGRDIIRLAQYDAGIEGKVINKRNSDVNCDGIVDGRDLIRLARYDAGIEGVVLGK